MVMNCKKTKGRREIIKKICLKKKLEFNMKTLFCDLHLQDEVEALIGTFFQMCNGRCLIAFGYCTSYLNYS